MHLSCQLRIPTAFFTQTALQHARMSNNVAEERLTISYVCISGSLQSISSSLRQHRGQRVEDLEDGDDGEAHAEAQDAAAVGHEPDDGDPLVPDDLGDDGRLDVDVHLGQVLARVGVHGIEKAVLDRGLQSENAISLYWEAK